MRVFGLTITRDPKPVPPPPSRYCTCDSLLHLQRSAAIARDIVIGLWLLGHIAPVLQLLPLR